MSGLNGFVRAFSEVIREGWLSGEFHDFVLITDAELVPVWREVAPNQPVAPLSEVGSARKCIIFDASAEASKLRDRLQTKRPRGDVLSFLTEYYPSVCAQTFAPGHMSDELGPGIIMFQTPRTGSHLMQGMIANLPDCGVPDEWIRPPLIEGIGLGVMGLVDHLTRCARHQGASHHYWAASIVLPFLVDIMPSLSADERARLTAFIRQSHAFLITRRDRVAQTWSQIRASHSGRFFALSPTEINKGLDEALLPVEKFWLWITINRRNFEKAEDLARTIMRDVGRPLPEVAYEELLQRPISEAIHTQVLGSIYDPNIHLLDPGSTQFVKQSNASDQEIIATLGRVIDAIEEVDFRRGHNLERAAVRLFHGSSHVGQGRFDIYSGRVMCQALFARGGTRRTVVLALEIAASDDAPVRLCVTTGVSDLFSTTITRSGAYLFLADDALILQEQAQYLIEVGKRSAPKQSSSASVSLVALYTVPVHFAIAPEFPWISSIHRTDQFAVYRFG